MEVGDFVSYCNEYFDVTGIVSEILEDLLEYEDVFEAQRYLEDVCTYGCISGVVSDLIYYSDTYNFFDRHYDEIMFIIEEWEMMTGVKPPFHDIKNDYAWLGYEVKAGDVLAILDQFIHEFSEE